MTVAYETIAMRLTAKLGDALGDHIESIVLYGSIAKKEARGDSDIDILVVTKEKNRALYDRISKIRTQIDLDHNTLTSLVQLSRDELAHHLKWGSPFLESVVEEGVILYDRGFIREIRAGLPPEG